jgi:hypothetical protein
LRKNQLFSPNLFILSLLAFSLSPRRAFTTIIATSYTLDYPTPLGTPPLALLIRPSKPYSSFSSWNPLSVHCMHNYTCNGQIINMVIRVGQWPCGPGLDLFQPNPNGWAGFNPKKIKERCWAFCRPNPIGLGLGSRPDLTLKKEMLGLRVELDLF